MRDKAERERKERGPQLSETQGTKKLDYVV